MIYLQITPFFPTPERFNGPFIYDQVRAIQRNGSFDKVVVLRPVSWRSQQSKYEYGGITVNCFKTFYFPSNFIPGLLSKLNERSFLQCLRRLKIDTKEIEVAHAHVSLYAEYLDLLKCLNPKIKTVIQYHDPDPLAIRIGHFSRWKWHRRYVARRGAEFCSKVDLHLCVSEKVMENVRSFPEVSSKDTFQDYIDKLHGLQDIPKVVVKKGYVLYNGVDRSIFYPDKKINMSSGKFVIGSVGNFIDWKDQITLIKAAEVLIREKNLTDIQVRFIGTGKYLEFCKKYVIDKDLSDFFSFEREVFHEQLRDFYNMLDLFVLPSYFEGFGCVFLEAYACGVPFICAKNQGISEYIDEKDCMKWMFSQCNFRELADRILAYKQMRYAQHLRHPIDIDILVPEFLKSLEE